MATPDTAASFVAFKAAIIAAHEPPQIWESCAFNLSSAIQVYFQAGVSHTTVTGVVYPPSGSSYPATGSGIESNKSISGGSALNQAINEAYHNQVWSGLGAKVANGIINYISSVIITTTVSGGLTGTGINGLLTSTAEAELISALDSFFAPPNTWLTVSNQIASAVRDYFDSLMLQTIDSGTTPPSSWSGIGVGNLIWS